MKKYRRIDDGKFCEFWIKHGEEVTREELDKRAGGWIQDTWDGSVVRFNQKFNLRLELVETKEEVKMNKNTLIEKFKNGEVVVFGPSDELCDILTAEGIFTRGGGPVKRLAGIYGVIGCKYTPEEYGIVSRGGAKFNSVPNISPEEFIKIYNTKTLEGIKDVIYNGPATIVILENGSKGVSICGPKDAYDKAIGFSVAYTRALVGGAEQLNKLVERL